MKYEQQINAWFASFENRLSIDTPRIIAETAVEYFQDRFLPQNQDWDKVKWKMPKEPYYSRKRRGKGRILYASGNLEKSIRPSVVSQERVRISAGSTTVPYARIHNEGLTVKGTAKVRPFTNRNFMGKGKPVKIKAHTRAFNYTMPKRQFMGHSPFLNAILKERLIKHFNN